MKKRLLSILMCLSLYAFPQQSNTYTLLDFYKDNWRQHPRGDYYEEHDLDSFANVNKAFKINPNCMNGLSMVEIEKIFGKPSSSNTRGGEKKQIVYMYQGGGYDYVRNKRTFGWLQIDFDFDTKKVVNFERNRSAKPED